MKKKYSNLLKLRPCLGPLRPVPSGLLSGSAGSGKEGNPNRTAAPKERDGGNRGICGV